MKRILLTILAIILCLTIFSSCSPKDNEDTRQIVVSSRGNGSDIEGIKLYASISDTPVFDIDFDVENPSITFHWINDTDNDFSYPLSFDILKQENDEWVSCATEEIDFPATLETVAANGSTRHKYTINGFNLRHNGVYRFIVKISDTENVWYDFQVDIATAG